MTYLSVRQRSYISDRFIMLGSVVLPLIGLNGSAWKRAWQKAGLPREKGIRIGAHNLRRTFGRRKINLSNVFADQTVGIHEVDDQVWLVSFMRYDPGFFNQGEDRVDPGPNPFVPDKVYPMSPAWTLSVAPYVSGA
jgi:hypothetical protein